MKKEEITEKIKELLDKEEQQDNLYLINEFFNLLFWKDYGGGYVDIKDRDNIFDEIKKATELNSYYDEDGVNDEDGVRLNLEKILPFVNKIRKQIGLKELTKELDNILYEITPEIKKRLILKRLEDGNK